MAEEVREVMLEGKRAGLSFEAAWERVLLQVTFPPEWRNPAPGEESVVAFTHRHYLAAWYDLEPGHPCDFDGCEVLVDHDERWCLAHIPEVLVLDFVGDGTEAAA